MTLSLIAQSTGLGAATTWGLAWQVAIGLAVGVAAFVGLTMLRNLAVAAAGQDRIAKTPLGPPLLRAARTTMTLFLAATAAYLALPLMDAPQTLERAIQFLFVVAMSLQGAVWIREAVFALMEMRAKGQTDEETVLSNAMGVVGWIVNLVIWSFAVLVILSNLGVDVTALIAGLGIGGIAIGLAAQGIVADLFAALSILFDRPFVKGDFVVIGPTMGEIEDIGLKTTRIRALSGEQIVVANAQLLARDVHNFRRMSERRMLFKLNLATDTDPEMAARIPRILEQIVTAQSGVRFDRAHMTNLGPAALEYEAVYFVQSRAYQVSMDTHQAILFEIMKTFRDQGVVLAGAGAIQPLPQPPAKAP